MSKSAVLQRSEPVCCPTLDQAIDRPDAERLAAVFRALGDPARIQLLGLIKAQPGGECACNMVEPLELTQPTVSHHLKVLHDAGLLERERRSTFIYYRVRQDQLAAIGRALS
jgi:ArsR family transcriptional regulator